MLDDYVIIKSDGLALYHLASVVDDHLMKITHVVRGSEWLPTFPLHSLIYRAFGWEEPIWAHLSVFLKPSGKGKMSKRETADLSKDGYSFFIKDMDELGYIPEAVVNWISLMGWSYDDHTEFFQMEDLIAKFSIDHLNPSPAAINYSKLDYFNGLHIRSLSVTDLARRVKPFLEKAGYKVDNERLLKIAPIIQERITTLDDVIAMAGFFFNKSVQPEPEELVAKNMTPQETASVARQAYEVLGIRTRYYRLGHRAAYAGSRRPLGPKRRAGFWRSPRGGYRAKGKPSVVREHGNHRQRKGAFPPAGCHSNP